MNTDTLYLIQWGSSSTGNSHLKWRDDKFMIPSPLSEALDILDAISKHKRIPSARLVPTNDDADHLPIVYKR